MNRIELTPLPIHKKSLRKDEQEEVQKDERSAVFMRRYEYGMALQKKKNEAKSKAIAKEKKQQQPQVKKKILYTSRTR